MFFRNWLLEFLKGFGKKKLTDIGLVLALLRTFGLVFLGFCKVFLLDIGLIDVLLPINF